jgi:multiple sugar transport system ATP-binding protein
MRGEIESLVKRLEVTTVYVTHDQVEAMTMGDRVAVLLDGRLQQVATPTEVYDRPANLFVAGFIGSPPMNLAQTTVEQDGDGIVIKLGDTTIPVPPGRALEGRAGKPVIVGIRPEDVQGSARSGGTTMQGTIERVEALGASLLGYFRVNAEMPTGTTAVVDEDIEGAPLMGVSGVLFCATFEPRAGIGIGDTIEVTINPERLHFFDPESEESLRR